MKSRILFSLLALYLSPAIQAQPSAQNDGIYQPKRIRFKPDHFYNSFSINVEPVLSIHSGDTVQSETIDALGRDKNGVRRQPGGNPLTGPFYILNSKAGDILKISLTRLSLNRNYAYTTETFVPRSMPDFIHKQFKKAHLVKWTLDIQNGYASPDSPFSSYHNLKEFKVPLHPFLGCIGVAPKNKKNEILSFFQGEFGGNIDYCGIRESSIIYLPVLHDGGYFYIGDGHAIQGDGEIAGNALETSLDVEFTIEIFKNEAIHLKFPRVEDSLYIIAIGMGKSLDQAIKSASVGLLDWLQEIYHLTIQEATQVMSTTIEYRIAEVADPEVVVVAKIKKNLLKSIAGKSNVVP
ncbi:MAG: acetamidase/formamidase family protein [Chitinophagales bacterium]